jgi:pyruvate/2-oxoglutarate dehydrogenase complex dihydrolipoamide dehydrogenase (E3) component
MTADVLVVGAGPAGLAAATELRRLGVARVLVADREDTPGGVPRHCGHTGFGLRDLHRVLDGPGYARWHAAAAARAGAEIRAGTTVTGWATAGGGHELTLTSPHGVETVQAAAVLLATGCRERPRPARLVPGARGRGIMTTGELQQRVYLHGERLPGRAVIVGAEHVSFSAVVALAHAGARVTALVTEHPAQQSYRAFAAAARLRWRVPVWPHTAIREVIARPAPDGPRLAAVDLADTRTGRTRRAGCDWLVFTGDWIPDHELARLGGVLIDPGTRGPAVDTALETTVPGVFAAGNLIHPAETADVAALGGRHAARQLAARLAGRGMVAGRIPVSAAPPLSWISPAAIRPGTVPPRGRFLLRCRSFRPAGRIEVWQGDRPLARVRVGRLVPGRPVRLPAGWVTRVDPAAGTVRVRLG